MIELYSVRDAAARLGVSTRRVQKLASIRGVGRRVGNSVVFTADDLAALKPGPTGRPKKNLEESR